MKLGPGANVIKLILYVIYGFLYKARVFVRLDWKSFTTFGPGVYVKNVITEDPDK
jgi:hypothetical protein